MATGKAQTPETGSGGHSASCPLRHLEWSAGPLAGRDPHRQHSHLLWDIVVGAELKEGGWGQQGSQQAGPECL